MKRQRNESIIMVHGQLLLVRDATINACLEDLRDAVDRVAQKEILFNIGKVIGQVEYYNTCHSCTPIDSSILADLYDIAGNCIAGYGY